MKIENSAGDMEMETRAKEDIGISQDLTPLLSPLSFALRDFLLLSRCSACFSAVSSSARTAAATSSFVVYCSADCSAADSSLHFSSAEHHLFLLLLHRPSSWPHGDSSDLRASLRLLRRLEILNLITPPLPGRIAGLLTNRDKLTSSREDESVSEDCLSRIKDGARAMSMARAMRDGRGFDGICELEEAMMCIVLTNAVEVQIGREAMLGIAVYDGRFSWINHSCSPNACYRFSLCSEELESSNCDSLLIRPAHQGIQTQIEDDSVYRLIEPAKGDCVVSKFEIELVKSNSSLICFLYLGCRSNGPMLVVRSIRMMKKGDEVTITYTDLMQPRMLRQSDLWFKHRFLCSCTRCSVASSYVDHALQETFHVGQHLDILSSLDRDRFVEEMRDYCDSVISDYMSSGNTESCCEKIENLLLEKPAVMTFRLSPIHHLSLSAYTVLSSAYKIQSSLTENPSEAFNMRRISTAYSFLLAGAAHHLFISDPSFIASAANFWTNAGESLVCFAQTSNWPLSVNQALRNSFSLACGDCLLLEKFKANFSCCVAEHEELKKLSQHFLRCITNIASKVWKFFVQDCFYLAQIEDPINFSWLEPLRTSNVWKYPTPLIQENSAQAGEYGFANEVRTNAYLLGAHCLIYGCHLSGVCYGQDSSADNYARKMLC